MLGWRTVKLFRNLAYGTFRPNIENNAAFVLKACSPSSIQSGPKMEKKVNPTISNVILPYVIANQISTSAILMSAPAKKKRKFDPMMNRAKEERKKKRIAKALRKMDRKPRIPKPLHELEVDPAIFGGELKYKRERNLPVLSPNELEDKAEQHALLIKEWSRFAGRRHENEIRQIDAVLISRQRALEELRRESHELYAEALKPDNGILDQNGKVFYQATGPTATPPIRMITTKHGLNEDWLIDGHYEEVTKEYAVQYADTKTFMNRLLASGKKKRGRKKAEDEE